MVTVFAVCVPVSCDLVREWYITLGDTAEQVQ